MQQVEKWSYCLAWRAYAHLQIIQDYTLHAIIIGNVIRERYAAPLGIVESDRSRADFSSIGSHWQMLVDYELKSLCAVECALALLQEQCIAPDLIQLCILNVGCFLPHVGQCESTGVAGCVRAMRAETMTSVLCVDACMKQVRRLQMPVAELDAAVRVEQCNVPRLMPSRMPRYIDGETRLTKAGAEIIIGGTGSLGLLTARWLVQHGARSLVLTNRNGIVPKEAWFKLESLKRADLVVWNFNTEELTGFRRLFVSTHTRTLALDSSIWYASGQLADAIIREQDASLLRRVCAPKSMGGSAAALRMSPLVLRSCVYFSSISGLLGFAGQANYCAANACLDTLASHCSDRGKVTVSVQWGAWAESAMVRHGPVKKRLGLIEAAGIGQISDAQGYTALQGILSFKCSVLCIAPIRRELLNERTVPSILSTLSVMKAKTGLAHTSPTHTVYPQTELPLATILLHAEQIVGNSLTADAPLLEAGMDSLGVIEIRNRLQRALEHTPDHQLPFNLIYENPTPRLVCAALAAMIRSNAQSNDVVLTYWQGRGRAEMIRLVLAEAKVDYENVFLPWGENDGIREARQKGGHLTTNIPLLSIQGQHFTQSEAILRLIARKFCPSLLPADDMMYRVDMLLDCAEDLRLLSYKLAMSSGDIRGPGTHQARDRFDVEKEPHLANFTRLLGAEPYFCDHAFTIADATIYDVLANFVERLSPGSLTNYPTLLAFVERVGQRPAICRWLTSNISRQIPYLTEKGKHEERNVKEVSPPAPIRILCLHGGNYNAQAMKNFQVSRIVGALPNVQFDFLDAPFESQSSIDNLIGSPLKWYDLQYGDPPVCTSALLGKRELLECLLDHGNNHFSYQGVEQSLALLEDFLAARPAYDLLIGFSQGAAMCTMMTALCMSGQLKKLPPARCWKGNLLVCGFPPQHNGFKDVLDSVLPIDLPSMHILGAKDELLQLGIRAAELYQQRDAQVAVHDGAHVFPQDDHLLHEIIEWIGRVTGCQK